MLPLSSYFRVSVLIYRAQLDDAGLTILLGRIAHIGRGDFARAAVAIVISDFYSACLVLEASR